MTSDVDRFKHPINRLKLLLAAFFVTVRDTAKESATFRSPTGCDVFVVVVGEPLIH